MHSQRALQHPILQFRGSTLLKDLLLLRQIAPHQKNLVMVLLMRARQVGKQILRLICHQQRNLVRVLFIPTGLIAPHFLQLLLAGHQDQVTILTVVIAVISRVVINT